MIEFFLDVEVEGVVEVAVIGGANLLDQIGRLGGRVEEVALEAVERLDGQRDAERGGIVGSGAVDFGAARDLIGGGAGAREFAERLMERAGRDIATDGGSAVDQPLEVLEGRGTLGLVGRNGVLAAAGHDADAGGFDASGGEALSELFVVGDVALEHRDFDAVIAGGLELFDGGPIGVGDVRGPEQEVEAEFHVVVLYTELPLTRPLRGHPLPRGARGRKIRPPHPALRADLSP